MSDSPDHSMPDIIATLHRLEQGQERLQQSQERLQEGQERLRIDLMARMDWLQHRADNLDEHLTMGLGHADRVERRGQGIAEDNRLLGEQMMTLTKIIRGLEGRINGLEGRQ